MSERGEPTVDTARPLADDRHRHGGVRRLRPHHRVLRRPQPREAVTCRAGDHPAPPSRPSSDVHRDDETKRWSEPFADDEILRPFEVRLAAFPEGYRTDQATSFRFGDLDPATSSEVLTDLVRLTT